MDFQRGIEMEAMNPFSDSSEECPVTSNTAINDDASIGSSKRATIDAITDTLVDKNTDAEIDKNANVDKNTDAEIDKNANVDINTSTDTPIVEPGTVAAIVIDTDEGIDTTTGAVLSGSSETAIDTVYSNIDATINDSTSTNVGKCNDAFASGNTESSKDAVNTRIDTTANESMIDSIFNAISDVALSSNSNDAIDRSAIYTNEKGEINEFKCKSSTDYTNIIHSGETAQPTNEKDCHYDSEIEIIDCTSESLEDQVASRSPAIYNPRPECTNDSSDAAVVDAITDDAENPRTNDTQAMHTKTSRRTKKELYEKRCANLRLYKMRKRSDDNEQPSKTKNRISHCLDKLTQNNMKFMENFDPKRSNRERRKLLRKTSARREKGSDLYGLNGALLSSGKNLCDCMDPHCPGCHFPCPRCHSPKCGHECRVNRKWTYEEIEVDGTEIVIKPYEIIQSFCSKS